MRKTITLLASFTMVCAFALLGCQAPVQDRTPAVKAMNFGDTCLENSLPVIQKYYAGLATPEEAGATWDCLSKSIQEFQKHARGGTSSSYSARELRGFIEENFLSKGTRISDALMEEVMRVKQVVLGGSQEKFTRAELDEARALMAILKEESLHLLPHIRVLTMDLPAEEGLRDPKRIEAALEALGRSVDVLAPILGRGDERYEAKNLKLLLRELGLLYQRFGGWDGPEKLIEKIPLLEAAKAFLLYPEGESIRPEEWRPLAKNIARLHALQLRSHYLMSGQSLLSGAGLDQLAIAMDEAMSLLESSVKAKPEAKIDFKQADDLIDRLYEAKLIDWRLQAATLKGLVRTLSAKVLSSHGSSAFLDDGITPERLARLRALAFGWLEMQQLWKEVTKKAVAVRPALRGRVSLLLVRKVWPEFKPRYRGPYEDLARVFSREIPLTYGPSGDVVFSRDQDQVAYDQDSFNSLNWKQTLIRVIVQGYAGNPEASRYTGITKGEFEAAFKDMRPALVDLKLVAPSDEKIWESTFDEINMFMLSAESDELLSFDEGLEFVSLAKSSSGMSNATYDDLIKNCLPKDKNGKPEANLGLDVYEIPIVESYCLRNRLRLQFAASYAPLATWTTLAQGWQSTNEWDAFEKTWETAARKTGYDDSTIESTDVDRMSMVLHYIESVFTRFDTNKSGAITFEESKAMFPVFRKVLAEASGFQDDETLMAIFTYLLRYGEAPVSWVDDVWFAGWKTCAPKKFCWRGVNADRRQLMKIVANLNAKPQAPVPPQALLSPKLKR